jgi:altronate dehydratase small subunit
MKRAIVMKADDNVATLLAAVQAGDAISVAGAHAAAPAVAAEAIDMGHKFALRPILAREPIVKYGEVIGYALADIAMGAHVHVHNIVSGRGRR